MIVYKKQIPNHEREIIEQLFYELQFRNSYYTTLQLLYNNSNHFSTISADKNLCTYNILYNLCLISHSQNNMDTIYIEGTIHSNYHISNVLFEEYTNRPLFVKDTYIRFSIDNINFMHLLVEPPIIEADNIEYIYYNESFVNGMCDLPSNEFIQPLTRGGKKQKSQSEKNKKVDQKKTKKSIRKKQKSRSEKNKKVDQKKTKKSIRKKQKSRPKKSNII
jgi:hypothetical protein